LGKGGTGEGNQAEKKRRGLLKLLRLSRELIGEREGWDVERGFGSIVGLIKSMSSVE
jgi:hypothetical protein